MNVSARKRRSDNSNGTPAEDHVEMDLQQKQNTLLMMQSKQSLSQLRLCEWNNVFLSYIPHDFFLLF